MTEQRSPIQFAKSYHLLQLAMIAAIAILCFMGSTTVNGYVLDGSGLMLGRDFLNMWHYGVAAFSENPAAYYDFDFYNTQLNKLVADYPYQNWSYPPHFMLIAAPFGLFGYNAALALMTGLSVLCFWYFIVKDFEDSAYRKSIWLMP
ncbi:MAG: glycosyltransferase 87 family protein, partial [Pseudomonadota bacterium]